MMQRAVGKEAVEKKPASAIERTAVKHEKRGNSPRGKKKASPKHVVIDALVREKGGPKRKGDIGQRKKSQETQSKEREKGLQSNENLWRRRESLSRSRV